MLEADPRLAWAKSSQGVSILLLSRYFNNQPVLRALLAAREGDLTLHEASACGDVATLRRMLEGNTVPDRVLSARSVDGFTPACYACFFGEPEALNLLLAAGADPNAMSGKDDLRPIHSASACGDATKALYMVQVLLTNGADPNVKQQKDFTSLHSAAANNYKEVAEVLIAAGADK
ncbi:hypothetical protein HK101_002029, partial [Irineochytrium annulatum]